MLRNVSPGSGFTAGEEKLPADELRTVFFHLSLDDCRVAFVLPDQRIVPRVREPIKYFALLVAEPEEQQFGIFELAFSTPSITKLRPSTASAGVNQPDRVRPE